MTQHDVGLTPPLPASNLKSVAARGGKRIDPRPWSSFVLARIEFGCLTKRRRRQRHIGMPNTLCPKILRRAKLFVLAFTPGDISFACFKSLTYHY